MTFKTSIKLYLGFVIILLVASGLDTRIYSSNVSASNGNPGSNMCDSGALADINHGMLSLLSGSKNCPSTDENVSAKMMSDETGKRRGETSTDTAQRHQQAWSENGQEVDRNSLIKTRKSSTRKGEI